MSNAGIARAGTGAVASSRCGSGNGGASRRATFLFGTITSSSSSPPPSPSSSSNETRFLRALESCALPSLCLTLPFPSAAVSFAASSASAAFFVLATTFSNGFTTTSAPVIRTGCTGRSVPSSSSPSPMRITLNIVASATFPNMVCFLSSSSHLSSVIKNWLPLLFGLFALAMATIPLVLNLSLECISSANGAPYAPLTPPSPVFDGSPVCTQKPGTTL
mmetsp:Transcript_8020/g.20678  ORF Transcript_8020/g.20678 Transcript_8020/m.20678 type:complete len:219 (+) Transcript_8020:341-997(+)